MEMKELYGDDTICSHEHCSKSAVVEVDLYHHKFDLCRTCALELVGALAVVLMNREKWGI